VSDEPPRDPHPSSDSPPPSASPRPSGSPPERQGGATEGDPERVEKAQRLLDAALEGKAERPVALDVRGVSSFADTFLILNGRSDRQVRAIAERVEDALRDRGVRPLGVEGLDEGRWVLIDFGDVVVHVFDPETRDHYDLERLWSDAAPLALEGAENDPALQGSAG